MSSTLSAPPPPRRRRVPVPRLSKDPDVRSVQVGVVATILIHVLLLLVAPKVFQGGFVAAPLVPGAAAKQFDIEIAPDSFTAPAPQPPPSQFVETNPDAPDNEPDKTTNFAAQNQQVAQEEPTPDGKSDRPALEGEKDLQSTQIVDGQLTEPTPPAASAPPVEALPEMQPAATVKREQNPLPGFEKNEGDNQNAFGSNVAKFAESAEPVPERVEGQKNVPLIQGATAVVPQIDPTRPQPRQTLDRRVRPAVFAENKLGTSNVGPIAVDARWSNYGQYLQKMIETVQIQWERILTQSAIYPTRGSNVIVVFRMDSDGMISEIVNVDGGSAGRQAEYACVNAITERAPYGKWTSDMIALLGDSQEMTFSFFYR